MRSSFSFLTLLCSFFAATAFPGVIPTLATGLAVFPPGVAVNTDPAVPPGVLRGSLRLFFCGLMALVFDLLVVLLPGLRPEVVALVMVVWFALLYFFLLPLGATGVKRPPRSSSTLERVEAFSEEGMLNDEPLPFPVDIEDGKVVPELRAAGTRSRDLRGPVLSELVEAHSSSRGGGGGKRVAGRVPPPAWMAGMPKKKEARPSPRLRPPAGCLEALPGRCDDWLVLEY